MSTYKPTNTAERKVFLQMPLLIYQTVALSEYMGSFGRGITQPVFVAQSCPGGTERPAISLLLLEETFFDLTDFLGRPNQLSLMFSLKC